jgi:hypothetical protein
MIRALLAGTKTQTRRAVALPRSRDSFVLEDRGAGWWPYQSDDGESPLCDDGMEHSYTCPYGRPGDRLWVREAHAIVPRTAYRCSEGVQQALRPDDDHDAAIYREGWTRSCGGLRWRPSIHMPRWASRITLQITSVRVERLQDISEADAIAEGIEKTANGFWSLYGTANVDGAYSPRSSYRALWDSINGPGSWARNPWVWVVEFKVIKPEAS